MVRAEEAEEEENDAVTDRWMLAAILVLVIAVPFALLAAVRIAARLFPASAM